MDGALAVGAVAIVGWETAGAPGWPGLAVVVEAASANVAATDIVSI
jgi:hypothetical protein